MNHNYISEIKTNILNGLFKQNIRFNKHLNIISGENGTGKTKLLTELKIQAIIKNPINGNNKSSQLKILTLSPKRNSEKKAIENAIEQVVRNNKTKETILSEYSNQGIQDNTFVTYPSFGDIFAMQFEYYGRKGEDRKILLNKVEDEFNKTIKKIFPKYKLTTKWDENIGKPKVEIKKSNYSITLNNLSCGEEAVLSLIFYIFTNIDNYQVFLIDEPEIHLNWDLEIKLFNFFNYFCNNFNKQIITTTHSRIVFSDKFYKKTQFLKWKNDEIICQREIDKELKQKLSGEAVRIIKKSITTEPSFFVEDNFHEQVLKAIVKKYRTKIDIIKCKSKSNVNSIYNLLLGNEQAFFLVDSDNEGNCFPENNKYIHLKKYCLECYFLDITVLNKLFKKSKDEIKKTILNILLRNKTKYFKKCKYLEFLLNQLKESDINSKFLSKLDCKELLDEIIKKFDNKMKKSCFIEKYLQIYDIDEIERVIKQIKGSK